jgi:hypothetical protein
MVRAPGLVRAADVAESGRGRAASPSGTPDPDWGPLAPPAHSQPCNGILPWADPSMSGRVIICRLVAHGLHPERIEHIPRHTFGELPPAVTAPQTVDSAVLRRKHQRTQVRKGMSRLG